MAVDISYSTPHETVFPCLVPNVYHAPRSPCRCTLWLAYNADRPITSALVSLNGEQPQKLSHEEIECVCALMGGESGIMHQRFCIVPTPMYSMSCGHWRRFQMRIYTEYFAASSSRSWSMHAAAPCAAVDTAAYALSCHHARPQRPCVSHVDICARRSSPIHRHCAKVNIVFSCLHYNKNIHRRSVGIANS